MMSETAAQQADRAAREAGVVLRELVEIADLMAVFQLYDRIWRPTPNNPPVTMELMRALAKAGNYVAGAFDGPELVGACVGFFGPPAEKAMHSHVAGISAAASGRGVGYALKLHQRAWALARGVSEIAWTFDPLVGRNAYFNLAKLGARVAEYLPDFYGDMDDAVNAGDDSDRLLVRWDLDSCGAVSPAAGDAVVGLSCTADGLPVAGTLDGRTVLVAVPRDIEAIRSADPGLAKEWRAAVREALVPLLAAGARVAGFDRAGWYVVTRAVSR